LAKLLESGVMRHDAHNHYIECKHSGWQRCAGDDGCYQIRPSLAAIGTAPNSVEPKFLITSTTLCPFK
jgi:hypothetical protein